MAFFQGCSFAFSTSDGGIRSNPPNLNALGNFPLSNIADTVWGVTPSNLATSLPDRNSFVISTSDNLSIFDNTNLSNADNVVKNEKITIPDKLGRLDDMQSFGERFKKWRTTKGVSATHIRKLTGVPESNISNIEAGRRPPSENDLQKFASVPELEIDYKTLKAWFVLDKAEPEVIERAMEIIRENEE